MKSFLDYLVEAFIIKVNAKGEKRRKLNCAPGYHPNPQGTACVPMGAEHKHNLKVGAVHAKTTKKGEGETLKKHQLITTKRANKYRKAYGLD